MNLPTPLERVSLGDAAAVFVKREDDNELGAFKWRGALPVIEGYRARGARAVVTASTGNHGAATAWASDRLGMTAIVYAPLGSSRTKLEKVASFGALLRLEGADLDEAKELGRAEAERMGIPFFEDGAEPAQYDGYGVIGAEILDQLEGPPGSIFVPVGNGALIGGIGRIVRTRYPDCLLVGAAAREAPVMALSHDVGEPVICDRMRTFADGLAVRIAIPMAVEILGRVVHRIELVSEREIARAIGHFAAAGIRVEGAAAAALAALTREDERPGPVVLVVTGRNIDEDLYRRAVGEPDSFPG